MELTLTELLVASLATWQAVEVWTHSSLMAPLRARAELIDDRPGLLLRCPFCLSVWVGFLAVLVVDPQPSYEGWPDWLAWSAWACLALSRVFVYGLAVSRLANLGNDLTHGYCRTPRSNRLDVPQDAEPGDQGT